MNVNNNHLIDTTYDPAPEGYIEVPENLNRAARRVLGKNKSAFVSVTSGGKLSSWARRMRNSMKP